ncbi:hypothetical protein LOK49_LG12G02668 [Camellia lanceoleosa]|uniref:Uncharacterized protein n=1 Tax=Camellia lanceoleosa TaxID=1840588 RepID=A0ACC0FQL7_9ERIC|nr:hypothetical protein LOK49_LG12G02668 [Camellia lanceoleosa]
MRERGETELSKRKERGGGRRVDEPSQPPSPLTGDHRRSPATTAHRPLLSAGAKKFFNTLLPRSSNWNKILRCLRTHSSLVFFPFYIALGVSPCRYGIKKLSMATSKDPKTKTYNPMSWK